MSILPIFGPESSPKLQILSLNQLPTLGRNLRRTTIETPASEEEKIANEIVKLFPDFIREQTKDKDKHTINRNEYFDYTTQLFEVFFRQKPEMFFQSDLNNLSAVMENKYPQHQNSIDLLAGAIKRHNYYNGSEDQISKYKIEFISNMNDLIDVLKPIDQENFSVLLRESHNDVGLHINIKINHALNKTFIDNKAMR